MPVSCPGIRRRGGGGNDLKGFFLLINFSRGPCSENSRENDISDYTSSKNIGEIA